jgi:excisionase family DNA binding protein
MQIATQADNSDKGLSPCVANSKMEPKAAMNKQQAAEYLGCSVRQLERYTSENRIAARFEKGRTRPTPVYEETELQRFKTEQERVLHSPTREIATQSDNNDKNPLVHGTQPMSQLSQFPPSAAAGVLLGLIEAASTHTQNSNAPRRIDPREAAAKLLLTLPEAQALTGLGRNTLRAAIDAGELKAAKVGRGFKIKREELERWIKKL